MRAAQQPCYVELHAKSAFSFHRGASQPESLVKRAAALGIPAIAITDRDGFYGSARAHFTAKECGIRAIVGTELTMEDGCVIPVLVQSREGYQNLCQLLTRAKLRAAKNESRIAWTELAEFAEGTIALTGDAEGPVVRELCKAKPDFEKAERGLRELVSVYGNKRLYVELQRHAVRGEERIIRHLRDLALTHGLPLLATNGVCYEKPEGRMLLDAFTCLRHHVDLDEAGRLLSQNCQCHLKGSREMTELFPDFPEAIANTVRLADSLEFSLEKLGYEFPQLAIPGNGDAASYLRRVTYEGARRRYHNHITPEITQKLNHELTLINKLGFNGYFLIVWDIVNYARDQGILVQGRGSAANSAVCYCLHITAADPIEQKLLFERFLSEGRKSWPDIDLDLPSGDRREQVIQEVYRRFAPHGAAMTANVITYRGRSAMREMGKVLGFPEDVISKFSHLYANGDFPHTMDLDNQLRATGLAAQHPRLPALIHLLNAVKGLPRHLGQHSGGMVLCSKGLDKIVPLEPASMPGRVVVQWDKDDCEDLGIIKVDLLGLGMMAVLADAFTMTCEKGSERAVSDLADIPRDDPETFALMQRADTIGVFQIESRAQMATLPILKPKCFYDVVIETAIIRPGPIVGKMVHPFLKQRKHPNRPIQYIHPSLEPVLERTLGVPLFQEQILQMAMVIADFSGSQAEDLRRAMSFHRSQERMEKVMVELRASMTKKGIDEITQDKIVQAIESFALYGFPEAHAISFAILAYASAWMKVHRAPEFYAALLNNQPMGFYSRATLIRDAKDHGVRIRPVCVVQSELLCTVLPDLSIRLGLNQVSKVATATMERLLKQRKLGSWQSLVDFVHRVKLPKSELRVLAKAGTFKMLSEHRRDALWKIEEPYDAGSLFAYAGTEATNDAAMPLALMTDSERLDADYQALHFSTGEHPMALIRERLPQVWRAVDLKEAKHGQLVTVGGQVICRQRPGTAKGHVFVSLEDETGIANAFVPSKTFEANRLVITQEPFLLIEGSVQHVDDVISVYALKIQALKSDHRLRTKSYDFH